MMRLALGREATSAERERLLEHYAELRALAAADPVGAAKLVGPHMPANADALDAAAWVGVARTVLNLDEFVTRD
jgi:hypothetical protein